MRKVIDKSLEITLVILMSVLVIDVLWQVISRYILTFPSSVTDEIAGFLQIWIGLLGAAYVSGLNEHLAIDLLLQRISPQNSRKLQFLIYTIIALFAISVLIIGGSWLVYTRFYLQVTSPSLQINLGYIYAVLPLSGLLITYYSIDNSCKLYQSKPEKTTN